MGFIVGIAVGLVMGLLIAPQRGDVTREELRALSEELRRRSEDLAERARHIADEAQGKTQKLVDDARKEARSRDGGTSESGKS